MAELYELLTYGRGSLNVAAGLYIRHDSAGDAYDVYSLVLKNRASSAEIKAYTVLGCSSLMLTHVLS